MTKMAFSPTDGLRNVASYPTSPANEAAAREQVQGRMDEIRNYLNTYFDPDATTSLFRQALINGNFDVWQRGIAFTNMANATYGADRFIVEYFAAGGVLPTNITHSKQAVTLGDINSATSYYQVSWDGAGSAFGAGAYYLVSQKIEHGTRLLCGAGKKATVSFWAKSGIANKKLGIYLTQAYGTGGSPSAMEAISGRFFTLTNAWTKYTHTFNLNTLAGRTLGTNNDDALILRFAYMWGSSIAPITGDTVAEGFVGAGSVEIAQVQLCAGDVALPFQPKSFEEELRACQRYYEKSYSYSVIPGTSGIETASDEAIGIFSNQLLCTSRQFKTRKRVIPAVTLFSYNGTAGKVSPNDSTATVGNTVTIGRTSERGFQNITDSATAFTAGAYYWFAWTADAEL